MNKFLMPIILLFVFSCSASNNDSEINNNLGNSAKHDLPKIECADKLEAYILKAKTLGQKDIDLITKWVCVSEELFFNHPQTNFEIVNPIYIAALDRNNLDSAIELEQIWCEHIKKHHNSGKGNDGYDRGKCNPKNYNPEKEGCDYGLCLFTEKDGKVAGASISSNRKYDGFNLFISESHDLPDHADSYGFVSIHEMFHIYQFSNLKKPRSRDDENRLVGKLGTGSNSMDEVPWWVEGNAVFFGYYKYAKEIQDREYFINIMKNSMWADWKGNLLDKYLSSGKKINEFTWNGIEQKIGYEIGAWFTAYLIDQVGEEAIYEFWRGLEDAGDFALAFEKYFGRSHQEYIDDFDDFLRGSDIEILSLLDRLYPY